MKYGATGGIFFQAYLDIKLDKLYMRDAWAGPSIDEEKLEILALYGEELERDNEKSSICMHGIFLNMIEIPGTIWHGIRLEEIKSLAHICEGFRAYGRNPCTILDYKDERIVETPGII